MPLSLQIRPYQAGDETAVISLWRACNLVVSHNDPRKDIQRKLSISPEWFLIGEMSSVIVATCMAGYEGHRGWINYLAVAPDVQRQRLATRKTEGTERLIRNPGSPKIPEKLEIQEFGNPEILKDPKKFRKIQKLRITKTHLQFLNFWGQKVSSGCKRY